MDIEYRIEDNGMRIYTGPKGVLTIEQTLEYFKRLKNDTRIKQGALEIVDFKEVTDFKISYVESQRITRSYQEPKGIRMIRATLFVCESELAYGVGRMLQTLHEITNSDHLVVLVRSGNEVESVIRSL